MIKNLVTALFVVSGGLFAAFGQLTVAQAGWNVAPKVENTDIRYGVYGMPDNRLVKKMNTISSSSGFSVSGSTKWRIEPAQIMSVTVSGVPPGGGKDKKKTVITRRLHAVLYARLVRVRKKMITGFCLDYRVWEITK